MSGFHDIDVPRRNGELAFEAPWESRAFALAAALVDTRFGGRWEPFRRQLIAAIADDGRRPYWESWTAALEALLVETSLLSTEDLAALPAS
ncbi:MAG: nitrile hydratase accessory protein [Acidimicrobiia bacterium]